MSVFQDLYDSEINVQVSCFWDGGWTARIGDEANGFRAANEFNRFGEIEGWLIQKGIELYPNSVFALIYRDGMSPYQARLSQREKD